MGGDLVYVVGLAVTAFRLQDGSVAWEHRDDVTEQADLGDGGVLIDPGRPGVVRVVAPLNYDLQVDRGSGTVLSTTAAPLTTAPADFTSFPEPEPTRFRVDMGLKEIVASWPDGRVAWRLVVEHPNIDPRGPVQAGDAIVLVTSQQHIVVLEPV